MKLLKWALVLFALASAAVAQEIPPKDPVPSRPFAQEPQPPAPDYRRPDAWAGLPFAPGATGATPPNATPAWKNKGVDVFYIHPTTFTNRSRWNQRMDDAVVNDWTDRSVMNRQAGAFNGCCNVYAPRYRQASLRSAAEINGDGGRAYDLAYTDITAAFDRFLAASDRPFILIGHSQGGLLAKRLLLDRIEGKPLQRRLVAAYVVGIPLAVGDFGSTFKTLKICDQPRQTGCVLSWNTYAAGADSSALSSRGISAYLAARGKNGGGPGKDAGARLVCSNPLAFAGRLSPKGQGALPAGDVLDLPALIPGSVSAVCDETGVIKAEVSPVLKLSPLADGNLHYQDISLFYAEVRADADRRADAFLKGRKR